MKKAVLKLNLHDDKTKQKAMKTVSGISGVDSVSMETKDQKLTVIGVIDPVNIVQKLRKLCPTEIVSVGPAKEEKKKEEPKKNEPKKTEEKKKDPKDEVPDFMKVHPYQAYNPNYNPTFYVTSAEEPNSCVII